MKQIRLFVIIFLLIILTVPSVSLAAWWNPLTWNIFSMFSKPQINNNSNIVKLSPVNSDKIAQDSARCAVILVQQNRDACYKYAASGDQYPSLCLKIEEQYPRDECYNGFANLTKDTSYCNKIQTSSMKTDCLIALGNIGKSGYRITNTSWSNPQVCNPDQISKQPQNIKDACYKEFARDYKDVTLCEKIKSQIGIEDCYGQVAIASKNPDICEKYDTQDKQNECYHNYAFYAGAQYCALITRGTHLQWSKDSCYKDATIVKHDVKACDNIIDPTIKKYCLSNAQ